jgi:hypothetical protein
MIDSICQAMSLYQDEEAIYSDFNGDDYNELIENQFSNIVKLMSRLGMVESIQEKVWLVLVWLLFYLIFPFNNLLFIFPYGAGN